MGVHAAKFKVLKREFARISVVLNRLVERMLQIAFGRCSTGISPGTIFIKGDVKTVHMEVNIEKTNV